MKPAKSLHEADRSMQKGKPYGRARHTGGGCFMVFEFYANQAEAEQGIADVMVRLADEQGTLPKQFVVYFPHLEENGA